MMKPSLQLKLGQSLTMTPQLQQAIRLLQLPVLDLNAQILEAIEENIMLEVEELPDIAETETDTNRDDDTNGEVEIEEIGADDDWQSVSMERDWSSSGSSVTEYADLSGNSLREHLLWQLELEDFTPREAVIGEALIDAIDDAGYLPLDLEEIREGLSRESLVSVEEIENTLRKVQRMDPAGVAARTPSECITLQLRQLSPDTEGLNAAIDIAEQSLDLVADQDYTALRHKHRLTVEDLDIALALVRGCNPKPGLSVSTSAAEYIVPDVYVRKVDGRWQVEISGTGIPRLSVNQQYAKLLRGDGDHSVLKGQLQEARWLVRSLEIRNETLLKVASNIVSRQTEFLEHGEEHMRPLVLRDIAEAVGMHESTISRVTTNKYMHTPRGIFEFKYFFSSHLSSSDGEDQSSVAVRAKIRKLIGAENPAKPLSDNKISKILTAEGINVARRTVAKYREAMNIQSSSERKTRVNR
jgi:RNA polymerase sigma-54 factor